MYNNKEILNYCPNYYSIINFDYANEDTISEKLIGIYKKYIFSIDLNNKDDLKKAIMLDSVLGNYLKDYLFRGTLQREIVNVKVKNDNNIIQSIVNVIIKIFTDYEEYTTRKLYISKWI